MIDDELEPWETDPDAWRAGADAEVDPPSTSSSAGLTSVVVLCTGEVVLTLRRELREDERTAAVISALAELGGVESWVLVRRSQGTHAPTVETWRRLT